METNIVVDISPRIPYLAKFWFPSYSPKCCQPIKLQDSLKCNISGKKWMMKFTFGIQINMVVFYKLILSFWMCVTRHSQNTQSNIFAISLQYLRKDVSDEVDFLHGDKHKGSLQIVTMIMTEAFLKFPK